MRVLSVGSVGRVSERMQGSPAWVAAMSLNSAGVGAWAFFESRNSAMLLKVMAPPALGAGWRDRGLVARGWRGEGGWGWGVARG